MLKRLRRLMGRRLRACLYWLGVEAPGERLGGPIQPFWDTVSGCSDSLISHGELWTSLGNHGIIYQLRCCAYGVLLHLRDKDPVLSSNFRPPSAEPSHLQIAE